MIKIEKDLKVLNKCALFNGIKEEDIEAMMPCLSGEILEYEKNQFIFKAGGKMTITGVILEGRVNIIKEDFWGNRTILSSLGEGSVFGESLSFSEVKDIDMNVVATEKTKILSMNYKKISSTCGMSCSFHNKIIQNMMRILAYKNIMLTEKMGYITKRTTREKLLSYLSAEALKSGKSSFEIPFNRQELADYLSIDRSAMTKELSKMRNEGILEFNKKRFILKNTEE